LGIPPPTGFFIVNLIGAESGDHNLAVFGKSILNELDIILHDGSAPLSVYLILPEEVIEHVREIGFGKASFLVCHNVLL
jgi:precorrin-4 methylase